MLIDRLWNWQYTVESRNRQTSLKSNALLRRTPI